MYDIMKEKQDDTFHFEILLAALASSFWVRMFLMLKLTKVFGPLIRIIYVNIYELGIFLVLWGIQLFIFSCMGILIFGELKEFDGFANVLILFFGSALGEWNLAFYDSLSLGSLFGRTFHMVFILINMVLFVNLVIAILSDTFARLSTQRLGLYYDGVIEVIPAYKYKKFYGALIAACPPFNLLVLPFLPFFMYTKHKKNVRRLNNALVKLIFAPFSLLYTVVFVTGNLLMLPFGYLVALFRKLAKICKKGANRK